MSTWHQDRAMRANPGFKLYHDTLWTACAPHSSIGGVMRFATREDCMTYCSKTGDIPLPPANLNAAKR